MILAMLLGCNTGKVVIGTGEGAFDARFITQVYAWQCGGFDVEPYPGTFGHEVVLYHAPASLSDLLPAEGCEYGVDMFPDNAGSGAAPIEGMSNFPEWDSTVDNGELQGGFGYWFEDVLTDEHTCDSPHELMEFGTVLQSAAHFSGAVAPSVSQVPLVQFGGFEGVIEWGAPVEATWESNDWDRVWVQMRRELEGQVLESLTCNVSAETSFLLTEEMWGLMDETLNVEYNNLYVTFEKRDLTQMNSGHWIETVSRAISIAVIED